MYNQQQYGQPQYGQQQNGGGYSNNNNNRKHTGGSVYPNSQGQYDTPFRCSITVLPDIQPGKDYWCNIKLDQNMPPELKAAFYQLVAQCEQYNLNPRTGRPNRIFTISVGKEKQPRQQQGMGVYSQQQPMYNQSQPVYASGGQGGFPAVQQAVYTAYGQQPQQQPTQYQQQPQQTPVTPVHNVPMTIPTSEPQQPMEQQQPLQTVNAQVLPQGFTNDEEQVNQIAQPGDEF